MHMNPPLSYLDPTEVARIDVLPGVTPVSLGGDSIGGTILVESARPVFASDDGILQTGRASSFYRSNSSAIGASAAASIATQTLSFRYDGSGVRAQDYDDGEGGRINASRFLTSNQQITVAYHRGEAWFDTQASFQYMPYQGFPTRIWIYRKTWQRSSARASTTALPGATSISAFTTIVFAMR